MSVVVVGSCMIDFVSYASRLPKPGETIHGYKFLTNFGGKGANQCVAASKLGAETALIARVGNDVWGEKYIANLKSYQINTDNVKITENFSTGIAQIIVAEETDGVNQIVIVAGANTKLDCTDVENAKDLIETAAVVVLQLETPVETAIKVLQLSKGISILNGAPGLTEYNEQLLNLPTIFCVNEIEAEQFTGLTINNLEEAKTAAKLLISKGCQSVLITLGSNGAIYLSKNEHTISVFKADSPTVKCIDSTGAGDAFIGALAYCLANFKEINVQKCIEAACLAAADSVTRLGTQISFSEGEEIVVRIKKVLNVPI